jgi:hypothetical protein
MPARGRDAPVNRARRLMVCQGLCPTAPLRAGARASLPPMCAPVHRFGPAIFLLFAGRPPVFQRTVRGRYGQLVAGSGASQTSRGGELGSLRWPKFGSRKGPIHGARRPRKRPRSVTEAPSAFLLGKARAGLTPAIPCYHPHLRSAVSPSPRRDGSPGSSRSLACRAGPLPPSESAEVSWALTRRPHAWSVAARDIMTSHVAGSSHLRRARNGQAKSLRDETLASKHSSANRSSEPRESPRAPGSAGLAPVPADSGATARLGRRAPLRERSFEDLLHLSGHGMPARD